MPARNKPQGKVLVGVITPKPSWSQITPDTDEVKNMVELRYVVTPELDGQQLQYRCRGTTKHGWVQDGWGEWQPVKTVFVAKKLREPKS